MELILLRHGKAGDRSAQKNDADRCLTPEGREEMSGVAKGLLPLIDRSHPVILQSSPLVRAIQTAEFVQTALALTSLQIVPSLATGDLKSFSDLLATLPADATLIAAGHEPFCSIWLEQITGTRLEFKKAAAACIGLKSRQPLEGLLLYYVHPDMLSRLSL